MSPSVLAPLLSGRHPRSGSRHGPALLPMLPTALLAAAALLSGSVFGEESWDYSEHGKDWTEGACPAGLKQSPINIDTNSLNVPSNPHPMYFFNYHRSTPVKVELMHFTLKVTPVADYKLSISGGGLPGNYIFDHVHFHWPGEHTVDHKRPIMEAHFVHRKDIYNTTEEATNDPEGIAVLSVLYTEGKENFGLFKIESAARNNEIVYLNFEHMLPYDKSEFYRYRGSLTTPACAESVVWTVFRNYVSASPFQVAAFRGLLPPEEQTADTYRAIQSLNGRSVELWSPSVTHLERNKVHHFHANPSILFAVIPGISNSIQFPNFIKKYV